MIWGQQWIFHRLSNISFWFGLRVHLYTWRGTTLPGLTILRDLFKPVARHTCRQTTVFELSKYSGNDEEVSDLLLTRESKNPCKLLDWVLLTGFFQNFLCVLTWLTRSIQQRNLNSLSWVWRETIFEMGPPVYITTWQKGIMRCMIQGLCLCIFCYVILTARWCQTKNEVQEVNLVSSLRITV